MIDSMPLIGPFASFATAQAFGFQGLKLCIESPEVLARFGEAMLANNRPWRRRVSGAD
jgi:hypothetical protein